MHCISKFLIFSLKFSLKQVFLKGRQIDWKIFVAGFISLLRLQIKCLQLYQKCVQTVSIFKEIYCNLWGETFCSFLVTFCSLLITFCSLIVTFCSLLVTCYLLLVTFACFSSLFACCSLLFARCSTRYSEGFAFWLYLVHE